MSHHMENWIPALAAALFIHFAAPAEAQEVEKCYGVALTGENDGGDSPGTAKAGSSKIDYQGDAWIIVSVGTCEDIELPGSRKSSRQPLDRDLPQK